MIHPVIARQAPVKFIKETYYGDWIKTSFIGHDYVFDPMVDDYYVLRLSWGTKERNSFLLEQVGTIDDNTFTVTFGDEGQYVRTYQALENFQP